MEAFDFIPIRYLNEFTYCPRLGYMEFALGEFEENEYTVDGKIKHEHIEQPRGDDKSSQGERFTSVILSSERLRIIGKVDLLEQQGGEFIPIEFKRGKIPRKAPTGYEPEKVQLCAQGLLLRENGYPSSRGFIYFADSHKRVEVVFDEDLVERTIALIEDFLKILESDEPPAPLTDSPKCKGCSLNRICMPDETKVLLEPAKMELGSPKRVRRLIPARDDDFPVYVTSPGTSMGKDGDRIVLRSREEELGSFRLNEVSQVCLYGNIQISAQALREMLFRGIPVVYFTGGGWFCGITHSHYSKNALLRIMQFRVYFDEQKRLEISRRFVSGKIRNCRTLVRRNLKTGRGEEVVRELARMANRAMTCTDINELLGIEGQAAHIYFNAFSEMIGGKRADALTFDFIARKKRPPTDPVNAMLSYGYSLLLKDCFVTLLSVGFDPYIGFYHQPKYGKPALALDLMEEFRPIVVDSVVLTCINNGEIDRKGFVSRLGRIYMKDSARKLLIEAYERRMDSKIKHPLFGYTISYRRVLEVQARILARYLTGEAEEYIPFCTR